MEMTTELAELRRALECLADKYHITVVEVLQENIIATRAEMRAATRSRAMTASNLNISNEEAVRLSLSQPPRLSVKQVEDYQAKLMTSSGRVVSTDALLSKVHYGIEMETTLIKRSNEVLMDNVAKAIRDIAPAMGRAIGEEGAFKFFTYEDAKADKMYDIWKITTDLSIKSEDGRPIFGLEFISPKLTGTQGLEQVRLVTEGLTRLGFSTNNTTALHVHVSCMDLTNEQLRRCAKYQLVFEEVIDQFMTVPRRGDYSRFCRSNIRSVAPSRSIAEALAVVEGLNVKGGINQLVKTMCPMLSAVHNSGRNHKVNWVLLKDTASGDTSRRLEFRQHQGTTDDHEISHWVRLLVKWLYMSANAPDNITAADGTMENFWKLIADDDLMLYYTVKAEALPTSVQFTYETREFFEDDTEIAAVPVRRTPTPPLPKPTPPPMPKPTKQSPVLSPVLTLTVDALRALESPMPTVPIGPVVTPPGPFPPFAVPVILELRFPLGTMALADFTRAASGASPSIKVTECNNVVVGNSLSSRRLDWIVGRKIGFQSSLGSEDDAITVIVLSPVLTSREHLDSAEAVAIALAAFAQGGTMFAHALCPHASDAVIQLLCTMLTRYEEVWGAFAQGDTHRSNCASVRMSLRGPDQANILKVVAAIERIDVSQGLHELVALVMSRSEGSNPEGFLAQYHHAAMAGTGRRARRVVFRSDIMREPKKVCHWLWLLSSAVARIAASSPQEISKIMHATSGNAERAFFEKIVGDPELSLFYRSVGKK